MSRLADVEAELKPLMIKALAGDATAYRRVLDTLRTLLSAYYLRRLGSARHTSAEDLVQDTLLAIHTRRMTYLPSEPLTAWVYAIARYKLIDFYRRNKLRETVPLDDDLFLSAPDLSGNAGDRMDVDNLLSRLPSRSAALVRDVKLTGLSVAEAADRHGMTETAAKVSIHRSLKTLAAQLLGGRAND
jgi:RNA polymerase sigma-70 factor (ECF subfamily)